VTAVLSHGSACVQGGGQCAALWRPRRPSVRLNGCFPALDSLGLCQTWQQQVITITT